MAKPALAPTTNWDDPEAATWDTFKDVSADELLEIITQLEQLDAAKERIEDKITDVLTAATMRYDVRAIRRILYLRRRSAAEGVEEDAVIEIYKAALGMS